jgi:CBS domain-containing protein
MPSRAVRQVVRDELIAVAAPDDAVRRAATAMAEAGRGCAIVVADGRLVGILTAGDLVRRVAAAGRDLDRTAVHEVMTRDPDTIAADEPVCQAIRMMDELGYGHLPVVEAGLVIGVLSARRLPFGEISRMQCELVERHALTERMR